MGKPIYVATMFLSGASCVGDLTGTMPLGGELNRCHIPVASNEPWDAADAGQELLELGIQMLPNVVPLRDSDWGSRHRNDMYALGTSPWDDHMGGPTESGATMYLQRSTDQHRRAAATPLIAVRHSRVPDSLPPRVPSEEL